MLLSVGSREWVYARAVFANAVNLAARQLNDTLIAATDIKDVSKSAIFLLKRDDLISVDRLSGCCRTDDKQDPNSISC